MYFLNIIHIILIYILLFDLRSSLWLHCSKMLHRSWFKTCLYGNSLKLEININHNRIIAGHYTACKGINADKYNILCNKATAVFWNHTLLQMEYFFLFDLQLNAMLKYL